MIALLKAEPFAAEHDLRGYAATGAVDGVARVCGWLGLLGLTLFGRGRCSAV